MNSAPPLRFGVIGCGTISATHADAIRSLEGTLLTACCDTDPCRATDFAQRYGLAAKHTHANLRSFLADPSVDAVTICTPSGLHAEIAVQCLEAGKPTIVEKPMDITGGACELLLGVQEQTDVPLTVISQHRYDAATQLTKSLVDTGRLGKLLLTDMNVRWFRSQDYYDSGDWRGTWALDGGGALMNQGVHTIDLMRWIAGPVHSVWAVARTGAHREIEVEDSLCATVAFENGAIGSIVASTAVYPGFPATLGFYGTQGSVVIAGDALGSVHITGLDTDDPVLAIRLQQSSAAHALHVAQGGTRSAEASKMPIPDASSPLWQWGDAHKAQIADFANCVATGSSPLVDARQGKHAVDLVLAIYESARTGKVITLL